MDFKITPTSAYLLIQNGRGQTNTLENISFNSCAKTFNSIMVDGSSQFFNISGCNFGSSGDKIKTDFDFYYLFEGAKFSKKASGSITARIS